MSIMILAFAALFGAAFVISLIGTLIARRVARQLGLMDEPGHRKVHTTVTPRNGGIGIFWGIALPLLAGVSVIQFIEVARVTARADVGQGGLHGDFFGISISPAVTPYIPGLKSHTPLALLLLGATFAIHLLGLMDDRKAMAPLPKLTGQLLAAAVLVFGGEWLAHGAFRVLTSLDHLFVGGMIVSGVISVLWITALTNAFNFLDNMDGLSAGVAFCCALMFLLAAGLSEQWFICGMLTLFMGSVLGFLCFNFPPASIFMGDGGSMVLGFFLSALTIRTTYILSGVEGGAINHWYALLAPFIILAVPLYDLSIVSVLRLARGRSPMTGDTNHFSHRLVRHGFSKRSAVLIIYAVTLASGLSAPLLTRADNFTAFLIALQTLAILVVVGILERVGEHTT